MRIILIFTSWILYGEMPSFAAQEPQIEKITKVLAIQQATIQSQKKEISLLKKALGDLTKTVKTIKTNKADNTVLRNLETAVDTRFSLLKIKTEITSHDPSGNVKMYENERIPRDKYLWNGDNFTGFYCVESNQVLAGSDYRIGQNYFHRTYCKKVTIEDKKWKQKIVPESEPK